MTEQDVEQILDRLGTNRVFRLLLLCACFGYVFDSLNNSLLGYAMPAMAADLRMSDVVKGYVLSAGLWGGVIGQLVWGWLADRRGRLFAFQGTIFTFAGFTGLTALAWSPLAIFATRFLTGAGLNGFAPVDTVMVSEFSPTSLRGRYTGFITVLWPVGAMAALGLSLFVLPLIGWRWLFAIAALPAILVWAIRRGVPESPRWLISQGREAEALSALRRLGATNEMISQTSTEASVKPLENAAESIASLFSPRWIRNTCLAWLLWFGNLYVGVGLLLWLPTLLMQVHHLSFASSLNYLLVTTACGFIGRITGVWLLDRVGRRVSLGYSMLCASACMLAFGFVESRHWLLAVVIALYFFNEQASVCQMAYIPELFPTQLRMKANAWTSASARALAATAPIVVGYALAANQYRMIAIVFCLSIFLPFLALVAWGPETRGKGLAALTSHP